MNPGKKRHIIVIQSKTPVVDVHGAPVPDAYGGPQYTWTDFVSLWAEEWPLKGKDLISAHAAMSDLTTQFVTRYYPGITGGMRIVYKNKYYDIVGDPINDEGQDRELRIMAKSGVNDG